MKVLHSFVDKHNIIWKEILYSQYLSAILAKKHYGNITFVGSPELVKQVKEIGLPYTEHVDNLLHSSDYKTWSIPKIKVFKKIKEPFLHIDNDTFIFNKIDFEKYNKPFIFSHPDIGLKNFGTGLDSDLSKLINSFDSPSNQEWDFYYDINNTYTRLFLKLINKVPQQILPTFDLGSIPNMNIVYVEDYKTFNKVAKRALGHYYENKYVIDKEEFGPCYIEQLLLHQLLRAESKKYRKYSGKYKHTVFKKLPFLQLDDHNNTPKINDMRFPFRGSIVTKCKCCGKQSSKELVIEDKEKILEFFDYDFDGFFHSTYLKWYDLIQAYTIHKLRLEIGDEQLRKVHNYFTKIYPDLNLPITSGGENLYEELTGFTFN